MNKDTRAQHGVNWLTHYLRHRTRHGDWVIEQEDGSGRFSIFLYPLTGVKRVFLGSTRTAQFAIVMLRAGETRHPFEIDPAQCELPSEIDGWEVVPIPWFLKPHWLSSSED